MYRAVFFSAYYCHLFTWIAEKIESNWKQCRFWESFKKIHQCQSFWNKRKNSWNQNKIRTKKYLFCCKTAGLLENSYHKCALGPFCLSNLKIYFKTLQNHGSSVHTWWLSYLGNSNLDFGTFRILMISIFTTIVCWHLIFQCNQNGISKEWIITNIQPVFFSYSSIKSHLWLHFSYQSNIKSVYKVELLQSFVRIFLQIIIPWHEIQQNWVFSLWRTATMLKIRLIFMYHSFVKDRKWQYLCS